MTRIMNAPAALTVLVALLLTGCAANVVTDYDSQVAYDSYSSWAFAPGPEEGFTSLDSARIEEAIKQELTAEDLTRTTPDDADLLVRYRIEEVERLDTRGFSYGLGFGRGSFGWGLSTAPPVRKVREGQLVVELVDTSSDRIVWRAASKRYLNENQSPETRQELIDEVVTAMFNKYPPGPQ